METEPGDEDEEAGVGISMGTGLSVGLAIGAGAFAVTGQPAAIFSADELRSIAEAVRTVEAP